MTAPSWQSRFSWILPILIALIVWQLIVQFSASDLLPSPFACFKALCDLISSRVLVEDCSASLRRAFVGFTIAALLGIAMGFCLGLNSSARKSILPLIELLRPIPPIAWIPIAITFFGIGDPSSYFVIFVGAFYPIFTNTLLGVKEVPDSYIDAAKLLGATKTRIWKDIIIPCSLPSIFAGLTVGLGFAWACLVAAEMIAARSGLGYEIQLNRQLLQLDRVIAGMAVIGFIGVCMNLAMRTVERKCLPWKNVSSQIIVSDEAEISVEVPLISEATDLASATGASLKIANMGFSYEPKNKLINNISLSINSGEFLTLLGPSGCGKTSLLRLIAGLIKPTFGEIFFDEGDSKPNAKEMTMVFQNGALFPWLTVIDNVAFAMLYQGSSRSSCEQEAKRLLSLVGLTKHFYSYPAQLSGGQQQRVALARALACKPRLLLLDEPFSALDSQTRESIQQDMGILLSNMGITVILVTHDIREAVFMSDHVLVLSKNGGDIVEQIVINEPRSKRFDSFRYSPDFSSTRAKLWQALHGGIKQNNAASIIVPSQGVKS